MTVDRIEMDGKKLEVARWGNGSKLPIVLLHEGLGSVRLWKGFPEKLAQASGREVIAWSREGHGWSTAYPGRRAPDYMHREAEALPALHQALGISRAHWLGHSDGGSIALIAAARFPELVSGLILEAPHVLVEDLTITSIASIAAAFPGSNMGDRMKRYHCDPLALFNGWSDIWLDPAFRDWDIQALLPDITAPALLLQGRDDQYGTLEQLDRIEAVLPSTIRVEFDHCGHTPHFDCEGAVLDAICAFLDGKE